MYVWLLFSSFVNYLLVLDLMKNTPVETMNRMHGINNMQPHDMHNTRGTEEMKNFPSFFSKL